MIKLKISILIACFLIISSCTFHMDVNPNLDVTTTISNRLPLNIGLYIPPSLKRFQEVDRASWDEKYYVDNLGEALYNMIYKALDMTFESVEILETYPTEVMLSERKTDGFIAANLNDSSLDLHKEEGFWTDEAKGNFRVSVGLKFFNPEMMLVTSFNCIGSSQDSRDYDFLYIDGKEQYKPVIEAGIRNLGDNIVQMVYGNYDIRKIAEDKEK
ncbi:hypothetical protein ACFLT2_13235 [Acidobacteriota bacterium]